MTWHNLDVRCCSELTCFDALQVLRGHTTGRMVLIGLDMQKVAIDFSHPGALSPY